MEKSAKDKGNDGELRFASFLRNHGFKAFKQASSGAHIQKGDITNSLDCTIEVKTVAKINLKEAWSQVEGDASMARNQPVLAIQFDGMRPSEWLMVMHSEDWAELMKREQTVEQLPDHRKKYAIQRLVESAKALIKLYE